MVLLAFPSWLQDGCHSSAYHILTCNIQRQKGSTLTYLPLIGENNLSQQSSVRFPCVFHWPRNRSHTPPKNQHLEEIGISVIAWEQGQQASSEENQPVNMSGFAGHVVLVTHIQLCHCRAKAARDTGNKSVCLCSSVSVDTESWILYIFLSGTKNFFLFSFFSQPFETITSILYGVKPYKNRWQARSG